jgi:hypothetical protein
VAAASGSAAARAHQQTQPVPLQPARDLTQVELDLPPDVLLTSEQVPSTLPPAPSALPCPVLAWTLPRTRSPRLSSDGASNL